MKQGRLLLQTLLFRQLQIMFSSGVGLYDSLVQLEKGFADPNFSLAVKQTAGDVFNGRTLSEAMARRGQTFEPLFIHLIRVGEQSGALADSLGQIAHLAESGENRRRHLASALVYPCSLLIVMGMVGAIFVVFVAPGDSGLMKLLGEDLPWPSRLLVGLAQVLSSPWLLLLIFVAVFAGVLSLRRAYRRNEGFRSWWDGWTREVPVIGNLIILIDSARVLDVLSTCLTMGMDIISSLKFACGSCSNSCNKQDMECVIEEVSQGATVSQALGAHTRLPGLAVSLIEVGEASGRLQEMSRYTANMLTDDTDQKIKTALELVEPILLCVGGIAAGFLAVATLLPIMRLVSNFS